MFLNDCLYYRGLSTTRSALSSVITVNGFIKIREYMYFFQDTLCQYPLPQHVDVSAILTFSYLIVAIQSVMKILSSKINNVVCYYRR